MSAPLVRVDPESPPAEAAPPAAEGAERDGPEGAEGDGPEVGAEAEVPVQPEAPAEPAGPVEPAGAGEAAHGAGDAGATRYCAMCGDRVPADPDGQRCHLGHRLSPAHAEPRGLLRRLFGRR